MSPRFLVPITVALIGSAFTVPALAQSQPAKPGSQVSAQSPARPASTGGESGGKGAASAPASGGPAGGHPTSSYRSAFDGYRGYSEQPVSNWRQSNDLVRQIGGWQAYAREGQGGGGEPGTAPAAGNDAMPSSDAAGHGGHGGMKMPMPGGMPMAPAAGQVAPLTPAASSPGRSPVPVKASPVKPSPSSPAAPASGHQMPASGGHANMPMPKAKPGGNTTPTPAPMSMPMPLDRPASAPASGSHTGHQ